jgi:DNA-binding transcriptional regulator YiaG
MNTLKHVRIAVFRCNQVEFAAIAGVRQGTVSRWEAGQLQPSLQQMRLIREEAKRRGIVWDDRWFFEAVA